MPVFATGSLNTGQPQSLGFRDCWRGCHHWILKVCQQRVFLKPGLGKIDVLKTTYTDSEFWEFNIYKSILLKNKLVLGKRSLSFFWGHG